MHATLITLSPRAVRTCVWMALALTPLGRFERPSGRSAPREKSEQQLGEQSTRKRPEQGPKGADDPCDIECEA